MCLGKRQKECLYASALEPEPVRFGALRLEETRAQSYGHGEPASSNLRTLDMPGRDSGTLCKELWAVGALAELIILPA